MLVPRLPYAVTFIPNPADRPVKEWGESRPTDWLAFVRANPFNRLAGLALAVMNDFPPNPRTLGTPERPADAIGTPADYEHVWLLWQWTMTAARDFSPRCGLAVDRVEEVLGKLDALFVVAWKAVSPICQTATEAERASAIAELLAFIGGPGSSEVEKLADYSAAKWEAAVAAERATIDGPDEEILRALVESGAKRLIVAEIEAAAHLSDKTVRERVKKLAAIGYVDRPAGPRGGIVITPEGRAAIGSR